MQTLVRSLLIYRLTGSATILGAMAFADLIPLLLFSLIGGALADRYQKKSILLMANILSMLVALGVALSITLGYLQSEHGGALWILVIASILQGSAMGFSLPSQQAILPEIVGKEQLMNAVSLNGMSMNVMRFLAPAVAGFLTDMIGFDAVYYTMAGLFCLSFVLLSLMKPTGVIGVQKHSAIADVKQGIHYIRHDSTIFIILLLALAGVVLSLPYILLMPIFADDVLKVGASGLGVLMSASGVGAIAGSLVMASRPNRNRGFLLIVSSILIGLALLGFSLSAVWVLSLILISLVGFTHASRMTLSNTLLQYYTQPEYRGRVMSVYMMEIGLMSFGAFGAGLLADAFGAPRALGSFSVLLIIISLAALIFLPKIRKLD